MTFLDKSIYFAARGVLLYPDFLATNSQLQLVTKTLNLFRSIYPYRENEEKELDYDLRPHTHKNGEEKFSCVTWQTNEHSHVNFRGNQNIPQYVQQLLFPRLFSLLAAPDNAKRPKRWDRLNKSRWHLDINLTYTNEKNKMNPDLQDFTCGSLKAGQTALLVYNVGAPALFRLGFNETTVSVPHNSLVVVTKKALEPGQQFLLPIFRDYVNKEEQFVNKELRRVAFSFKYTLPASIRDQESQGNSKVLA